MRFENDLLREATASLEDEFHKLNFEEAVRFVEREEREGIPDMKVGEVGHHSRANSSGATWLRSPP